MAPRDDAQLLLAWRGGDAGAGNELVERHFAAIYAFFRNKLGGEIDDLIQRVFLSLVESKDGIVEAASMRTYLFRIARNELFDHLRRRQRQPRIDGLSASVEDLGERPSEIVAGRQEQRLLLRALRRIPLDDQIALELFYWEKLTGGEVGRVLGVPEGTARTRLRRARLALRAEIERQARSPEVARSTTGDLEHWVASLRACVAADPALAGAEG